MVETVGVVEGAAVGGIGESVFRAGVEDTYSLVLNIALEAHALLGDGIGIDAFVNIIDTCLELDGEAVFAWCEVGELLMTDKFACIDWKIKSVDSKNLCN